MLKIPPAGRGLLLAVTPFLAHAQPAVIPWGAPGEDDTDWSETNCLARLAETVCRYPSDPGPGFTFEVTVNQPPVADWEAAGWPYTGFRVFSLDRDDEGTDPEHLVVANNDGVSNGMAVSYWTLYVLEATPDSPVLRSSVPVKEFGADGGSFDTTAGDLVLWATEWLDGPDPTGQRGDGLYFVGRPFRLEGGHLVPADDLLILTRRFLDRFAQERMEGPAEPVMWLGHPSTETRTEDPYLSGGRNDGAFGTIMHVEPHAPPYGGSAWLLDVLYDEGSGTGETSRYVYSDTAVTGVGEDVPLVRYLGDGATERLYPSGYVAVEPHAWLEGRRVYVTSYGTPPDHRTVLWLE